MMSLKKCLFSFLALFLLHLSLYGQQYELMRVAKIEVVVENLSEAIHFNANQLRAQMGTKEGNYFSQNEFDNDLKLLAEEYDRVEPTLEVRGREICITLHIWLKPTIRTITFCGNERISEKKLRKKLETKAGSLFERETFIQSFNELKLLYVKKGYFEAELDYTILPVEGCNQIDIQINICEGQAGRIKEIRFCHLTSREEDEILNFMVTKKYNILLNWYTGSGVYHPDMIEHDRMQIINFLQNEGYADAMVDICIEETQEKKRIALVISVDKGQCYQFGEISFCGNTLFTDEQVWKKLQVKTRYAYSPESIRCTLQAITDLYGTNGYIDAFADLQLSLREGCPVYDVNITIEEGEQYYVGLINVFGNLCTQNRVILHESLLCPGEIFNNRRLEGTEARLYNTGFFSSVNVYAVTSKIEDPNGCRKYRDVYIEVEECDTGNIGLFGGFSSLDRIFGGVEVSENNFNLAGLTRIFGDGPRSLRGGGEYSHFKANIGNKQTSYVYQWTKPYFLDTPWFLGIELEKTNNRVLSEGYEIKTYGGSVHGTYIMNEYLKHDIHYRARHTGGSVSDSKNILLEEEGTESGLISAAGFSLIYDSTNHPRRASCGFRSRFLYELAGIGGNYQFMKFAYLNTYYYPVCKRGTFKLRADVQFIKTYGSTTPTSLPLGERLFLGGETTVRGYRPFIIGPKFAPNSPRGGVSSFLLSQEYQHNLLQFPCLDAFAFVDAGYVSLSEFTLGKQAASVGFGIRIELMRNTPMMFGLGWPIHPHEKFKGEIINNAQRFFFSMGGTF